MSEEKIAYRESLDRKKCECGEPDCTEEVYLHSKCHPMVPTWVKYENGILTILCAECDKAVGRFAVRSIEEN